MSLFTAVEMAPRDPILGLNEQFATDKNPLKVNLGVGVYFDDNGKIPLLECVQLAEKELIAKPTARGYLPIDGIAAYDAAVKSLVFGEGSEPVTSGRVATVQTLGGTGGLKVGADFLRKLLPKAGIMISDPSWEITALYSLRPALRSLLMVTTTRPKRESILNPCWLPYAQLPNKPSSYFMLAVITLLDTTLLLHSGIKLLKLSKKANSLHF